MSIDKVLQKVSFKCSILCVVLWTRLKSSWHESIGRGTSTQLLFALLHSISIIHLRDSLLGGSSGIWPIACSTPLSNTAWVSKSMSCSALGPATAPPGCTVPYSDSAWRETTLSKFCVDLWGLGTIHAPTGNACRSPLPGAKQTSPLELTTDWLHLLKSTRRFINLSLMASPPSESNTWFINSLTTCVLQ